MDLAQNCCEVFAAVLENFIIPNLNEQGCDALFDPVGERIREQEQQNETHAYRRAERPASRQAGEKHSSR